MLFFSLNSISSSISSSQNVAKFIYEHKDCDSILFKNEMINLDLENKLKIVESLIFDIIRKFSYDNEEFEQTKKEILEIQQTVNVKNNLENDYLFIEMKCFVKVLERIDEPLKLAIFSTTEVINQINLTLIEIKNKINNYKKTFIKNIISLSLQEELKKLNRLIHILDNRLQLFFELLKIYLPFKDKNV
jgi:hypothetical protein